MKRFLLWFFSPVDRWLFQYLVSIGGTLAWFQGIRGSGDWGVNERPTNFREMILWRNPNGSAPLTALLSKVASRKVDDPQFQWWEEELAPIRLLASGSGTSSQTTVAVSSGANALAPGDLLQIELADVPANEVVQVVSVQSDTSFTVTRGFAATVAAAWTQNVGMTRVGTAFAEGTNSPTSAANNPTLQTNYCQIFKKSVDITKTAELTYARTGDPWKNDKKRKMFHHSADLEWAFLFGQASLSTGSNGKPIRTTQGLRGVLTTNATVFATTPTETTFLNSVYPVFDYDGGGGNQRLVLAGNGFLNSLNKLAKAGMSVRVDEVVKLYGMNLQRWIIPQGELYLRSHPLMNVHPIYTYSAFVIDPSALVYVYVRDTHFEDEIQLPDADERKGQWLSECGLEYHHQRTMAYIGNFVI